MPDIGKGKTKPGQEFSSAQAKLKEAQNLFEKLSLVNCPSYQIGGFT